MKLLITRLIATNIFERLFLNSKKVVNLFFSLSVNWFHLNEKISKEYKKLVSGTKGSSDVIVTSAFELTDEQIKKITTPLKSRYGDSLNVEQIVDNNLIGGFSIKCGDEVTDYSIKGKLEKLRNQIK